jgi:hypothetical protein
MRTLEASTISSGSAIGGVVTSTKVTGAVAPRASPLVERCLGRLDLGVAASKDSRHFHHDKVCALMPSSAAYSFAVSPLSFQR